VEAAIVRARMKNPAVVIPGALEALQALGKVGVQGGGVPMRTIGLVQLRTSMINGWVHAAFVKKTGDTDQRLHAVATWRDAPFFTDSERAVLALTDAITRLSDPVTWTTRYPTRFGTKPLGTTTKSSSRHWSSA
jgi:hypothetical protein